MSGIVLPRVQLLKSNRYQVYKQAYTQKQQRAFLQCLLFVQKLLEQTRTSSCLTLICSVLVAHLLSLEEFDSLKKRKRQRIRNSPTSCIFLTLLLITEIHLRLVIKSSVDSLVKGRTGSTFSVNVIVFRFVKVCLKINWGNTQLVSSCCTNFKTLFAVGS